jgi:hypothetical protein
MSNTKVIVQGDTANEVEMLFAYSVNPDELTLPLDTVVHMTWYNIDTGHKAITNKVVPITSVGSGVINVTYVPVNPDTLIPGRYRATLTFTVTEGQLTMPTVTPVNILITEGYS